MPVLQSKIEESQKDVDGLCMIFDEFGVQPDSKILDLSGNRETFCQSS